MSAIAIIYTGGLAAAAEVCADAAGELERVLAEDRARNRRLER